MLTLPFLHELRNELDTRVIVLDRDMEDQIESLQRVWKRLDIRQDMQRDDIRSFLEKWARFRDEVCDYYAFPLLKIRFNEIIQKQV